MEKTTSSDEDDDDDDGLEAVNGGDSSSTGKSKLPINGQHLGRPGEKNWGSISDT